VPATVAASISVTAACAVKAAVPTEAAMKSTRVTTAAAMTGRPGVRID
jgi:spore maturation protein SpmB